MSDGPARHFGVMEGKGAYNRLSRIPGAGGGLAIPLLEEAAGLVTIGSDRPIVIADYGSSQGKNSLAPIRAAIAVLRSRVGAARPILVYHTDLPDNDFSTLFEVVDADPDSYAKQDPLAFPCAIGRSFYGPVLPAGYVDLGWSSYAAVWLSQVPMQIPGHFFIPDATGAVRAAFERQAALDWAKFLALRAAELRPGGRLVVALPALGPDGRTAFSGLMDHANATLAELVEQNVIRAEERARMTLGAYPRREAELVAPFAEGGRFAGLAIEHVGTAVAPDTAWTDYESDHDATALAAKRAQFFRVIFLPTLAQALSPERTAAQRAAFTTGLEQGLRRRLLSATARLDHLVGTIVLAKEAAA